MERWTALHNHSEMSNLRFLDSTNKIELLIQEAHKIGLNGIALTDHETISGWVRAIKAGKKIKEQDPSFKVILGNEIYLVDGLENNEAETHLISTSPFWHFILLAKDEIGGEQIRAISSKAWEHSYKTGKIERVPTVKSELEEIIGENKGHIIASTACIGGELGHWILNDRPDKCLEFIDWCQEVFGEENFFLEMQPNSSEEQKRVNSIIIKISEQLQVPFIITTDAHYLNADMAKVHEAYLNSREDESREVGAFYETCYLMDSNEIHERLDEVIGKDNVSLALSNTNRIKDMIQEFDMACPTMVPASKVPEFEFCGSLSRWYDKYEVFVRYMNSENIYDRYLFCLIEYGVTEKLKFFDTDAERAEIYVSRIAVELEEIWKVTEKLGESIASYYLTTREIINIMWDEGESIVGIARGSVTGMLTMYLIGITQLDPIPYDLKEWRHISSQKIELSDIDIDTQANRRSRIIEATRQHYGADRTLNCCTFKTEGSKSAILTSGRGLGLSNDDCAYIANMIPVTRGNTRSLHECLYGNKEENIPPLTEFINECDKYEGLLETALSIEGLISGRSIHASAVYLFNDPYIKHNAMMKAPNGVPTTQFNMADSDYCGGLKMD